MAKPIWTPDLEWEKWASEFKREKKAVLVRTYGRSGKSDIGQVISSRKGFAWVILNMKNLY